MMNKLWAKNFISYRKKQLIKLEIEYSTKYRHLKILKINLPKISQLNKKLQKKTWDINLNNLV